jgi:hypothetical protein
MISALIITKDAYDKVKNLCNLLDPYVDEIVIVHSSEYISQRFKEISLEFPKVYATYKPQFGYVEAYYKEGIKLCKHDWILLLDDDEIPCDYLLKHFSMWDLSKPQCSTINRFEPNGQISKVIRLFHKDAVEITGLIHRGIEPRVELTHLPKEFYLIHKSSHSKDKCKKFAKIEAEQYPQIIAHVVKKHKSLQYMYFIISSIPRLMFAPNKKDLSIYLKYLLKELRNK